MISRTAGYTSPHGRVLGFYNGGTDDHDGTSDAFCNWDRAVLTAARIIRVEAGSGCPFTPA